MPKIVRSLEVEVSQDELAYSLLEATQNINQGGAFRRNTDGTVAGEVKAGEFYLLRDYANTPVMPDTAIYVVTTVPEAGIVWAAFYSQNGQPQVQFLNPALFGEQFKPAVPQPAAA